MGTDMFLALGKATADGFTHFGLNHHAPSPRKPVLKRIESRTYCADETVLDIKLVQPRRTFTVVGCHESGAWGLTHGVNERHVAVGLGAWQSKLESSSGRVTGPELVRLALERSKSARSAVDLVTDLISRFGLTRGAGNDAADSIFLIADGREAFLVEAAGNFWATVQCEQLRAVTDVALVHQEWGRLSRGLAEVAIANKWRIDDGRKLDFAASLSQTGSAERWGLRRWGRATLLLEQQHSAIDSYFLRRTLADHFDTQIAAPLVTSVLPGRFVTSFQTSLTDDPFAISRATWAFGTGDQVLYLPIFLDGELPSVLMEDPQGAVRVLVSSIRKNGDRHALEKLQSRLDQEADQFAIEGRELKGCGDLKTLKQRATQFMHQCVSPPVHAAPAYTKRQPTAEYAYVSE